MANGPLETFSTSDKLARSVWVVVDPRDGVTGSRVTVPLKVSLDDVTAEPIAARSNVYCFMDLNLPSKNYMARVRPLLALDRLRYFDGEQTFTLAPIPVPTQPLQRNRVIVDLRPRPAYPFDAQSTLVRGRLVKASDGSPIPAARISLLIAGSNKGKSQTDERGEFVVFLPREAPRRNSSVPPLNDIKFQLRFDFGGLIQPHPAIPTDEDKVKEGTTKAIDEIIFVGT